MQHLDLPADEAAARVAPLTRTADDRYPLSSRIRTLRAIFAKLRPEPLREQLQQYGAEIARSAVERQSERL